MNDNSAGKVPLNQIAGRAKAAQKARAEREASIMLVTAILAIALLVTAAGGWRLGLGAGALLTLLAALARLGKLGTQLRASETQPPDVQKS